MRGPRHMTLPLGGMLLLGVLVCCGGCANGNWGRGVLRDDIVWIVQYSNAYPWLRDEDGRVNGLAARVYFISSQTEKGAFVPGTFQAQLHTLTPLRDGSYQRELVQEWSYSEERARGFRMTERSLLGESYGLVLRWPSELGIVGREVQLKLLYSRQDGAAVIGRGSRLRVPPPSSKAYRHEPRPQPSSAPSAAARRGNVAEERQ